MLNNINLIGKLFFLIFAIFASSFVVAKEDVKTIKQYQNIYLSEAILNDKIIQEAKNQASQILRNGVNAGSHYKEVWIRDLNTFIAPAINKENISVFRDNLLLFIEFQGENGEIADGIVVNKNSAEKYNYLHSKKYSDLLAFKNTVATDQESSLVQAFAQYIRATGDVKILQEIINGMTVLERLEKAMFFLMKERSDSFTGLLWGGTTADWGDVQPETLWGTSMDSKSHHSIDVYDNAMFIIALKDMAGFHAKKSYAQKKWNLIISAHTKKTRKYLWDAQRKKFIPHIYIKKSPFPKSFQEKNIHFHGGTVVAIAAGLLQRNEIYAVYKNLKKSLHNTGAKTLSLTIEPAYPDGFFLNPIMKKNEYQNGGEWDWFGCRWVSQLAINNYPKEAYEELKLIVERQIKVGFFEWYTHQGEPRGAAEFKGSAGACSMAIDELQKWAKNQIN